jgi:hypothetical protein
VESLADGWLHTVLKNNLETIWKKSNKWPTG